MRCLQGDAMLKLLQRFSLKNLFLPNRGTLSWFNHIAPISVFPEKGELIIRVFGISLISHPF